MGGYHLLFLKGYVNFPGEALISELSDGALVTYIVLSAIAFLTAVNLHSLIALGLTAFTISILVHNSKVLKAKEHAETTTITLDNIMETGTFSVAAFDNLFNSNAVKNEVHEQMSRLKDLLILGANEADERWHSS